MWRIRYQSVNSVKILASVMAVAAVIAPVETFGQEAITPGIPSTLCVVEEPGGGGLVSHGGLVEVEPIGAPVGDGQENGEDPFLDVRTIVIDPGHGGAEPGAIGRDGVREADLALAVALELREELRRRQPEVRVVLTREDDRTVTLEERSHLANLVGADLFVSLHFNSGTSETAIGIETWYLAPEGTVPGELVPGREEDGPAELDLDVGVSGDVTALVVEDLVRQGALRESGYLAETIQRTLVAETGAPDREVRQGRFRVLRGARMPAVVVELGFLTHAVEGERILEPGYRTQLAIGLADALAAWDEWSYSQRENFAEPSERLAEGGEPGRAP